ncbi:intracellular protein transport protein USO1-like [Silurus meridionalis]|uniref:intracellular protein transport protein USO1-like n=1 Tax=Silurus meridionalis TaxID=175797 RepID=UPI001EEAF3CF|nr:intracellular protein transport protein USO1-like [Silurus meridionalis]
MEEQQNTLEKEMSKVTQQNDEVLDNPDNLQEEIQTERDQTEEIINNMLKDNLLLNEREMEMDDQKKMLEENLIKITKDRASLEKLNLELQVQVQPIEISEMNQKERERLSFLTSELLKQQEELENALDTLKAMRKKMEENQIKLEKEKEEFELRKKLIVFQEKQVQKQSEELAAVLLVVQKEKVEPEFQTRKYTQTVELGLSQTLLDDVDTTPLFVSALNVRETQDTRIQPDMEQLLMTEQDAEADVKTTKAESKDLKQRELIENAKELQQTINKLREEKRNMTGNVLFQRQNLEQLNAEIIRVKNDLDIEAELLRSKHAELDEIESKIQRQKVLVETIFVGTDMPIQIRQNGNKVDNQTQTSEYDTLLADIVLAVSTEEKSKPASAKELARNETDIQAETLETEQTKCEMTKAKLPNMQMVLQQDKTELQRYKTALDEEASVMETKY